MEPTIFCSISYRMTHFARNKKLFVPTCTSCISPGQCQVSRSWMQCMSSSLIIRTFIWESVALFRSWLPLEIPLFLGWNDLKFVSRLKCSVGLQLLSLVSMAAKSDSLEPSYIPVCCQIKRFISYLFLDIMYQVKESQPQLVLSLFLSFAKFVAFVHIKSILENKCNLSLCVRTGQILLFNIDAFWGNNCISGEQIYG